MVGMFLVIAPLINMYWLDWIIPRVGTGYGGALIINIPFIILAWIWGYGVRRACNQVKE